MLVITEQIAKIILILACLNWFFKWWPIFETRLAYSHITLKILIDACSNYSWIYLAYVANIIFILQVSFLEQVANRTFLIVYRKGSTITTIKLITFIAHHSGHVHLSAFSTLSSDKCKLKSISVHLQTMIFDAFELPFSHLSLFLLWSNKFAASIMLIKLFYWFQDLKTLTWKWTTILKISLEELELKATWSTLIRTPVIYSLLIYSTFVTKNNFTSLAL